MNRQGSIDRVRHQCANRLSYGDICSSSAVYKVNLSSEVAFSVYITYILYIINYYRDNNCMLSAGTTLGRISR